MSGVGDEFDWIASLRPLTRGDGRARDLRDDAAILAARAGWELVISTDAMVEGVHFPPRTAPDIIARRLLRVSLSDLAAKAAAPFGYLLTVAWPPGRDDAWRDAFRAGLREDGETYGLALLGGDTVSTTGPLVASATVFGWAEAGKAPARSGALAGDALVVCGTIGDGWLGLNACLGQIDDPGGQLAARYLLPEPLFALRQALGDHVRASADVSDGLLADAGHIAETSRLSLTVELDAAPLSAEAAAWITGRADRASALLALATGGDDYAIVCAVASAEQAAFLAKVRAAGVAVAVCGRFGEGVGLAVHCGGRRLATDRLGWRHSDPD